MCDYGVDLREQLSDGGAWHLHAPAGECDLGCGGFCWAAGCYDEEDVPRFDETDSPALSIRPSGPASATPPAGLQRRTRRVRPAQATTAEPQAPKTAKMPQGPPAAGMPLATTPASPLVPMVAFTQHHVNSVFDLDNMAEVKAGQYGKMLELHREWHYLHDKGIASFEVGAESNVFGFTSVHVLRRAPWDARMLELGLRLSRIPRGGAVQEPVACIYEIMKYCGMVVVRRRGAKPLKKGKKKSLTQDSYIFTAEKFARNKARVNDSRSGK